MGREIKRVPLDFDHPINEIWDGYNFPDELSLPNCPDCLDPRTGENDGYTTEARAIANTFYPHMVGGRDDVAWADKLGQAEVDNLIADGRLRVRRDGKWETEARSADDVNREQRQGGLGHDAVNRWILVSFRCERLGIVERCRTCAGECTVGTDEQRAASEGWEGTDPPTGEGWQLWETVSEGSPISPVFDSAEGLARWMSTDYEWGATKPGDWAYDDALRWINGPGWAPTFVMVAAP